MRLDQVYRCGVGFGQTQRFRDGIAKAGAVITLAENLGLHVVAEGIENIEQLALLQALGCPAGQGYFLARPMEPSQLEGWWSTFVGEAFEAA